MRSPERGEGGRDEGGIYQRNEIISGMIHQLKKTGAEIVAKPLFSYKDRKTSHHLRKKQTFMVLLEFTVLQYVCWFFVFGEGFCTSCVK